MILVDSSVMIDALRKPNPKIQSIFSTFQPAICGIVLAEVLHGAKDNADYNKLLIALTSFPQLLIPEALWPVVGRNLWTLRSNGISVPFQDVVIATVAIENDLELWTHDNQFQLIRSVLPALRLFQEPP